MGDDQRPILAPFSLDIRYPPNLDVIAGLKLRVDDVTDGKQIIYHLWHSISSTATKLERKLDESKGKAEQYNHGQSDVSQPSIDVLAKILLIVHQNQEGEQGNGEEESDNS